MYSDNEIVKEIFKSSNESYFGDLGRLEEQLHGFSVEDFLNARLTSATVSAVTFQAYGNAQLNIEIERNADAAKSRINQTIFTLEIEHALKELIAEKEIDDDAKFHIATEEPMPIILDYTVSQLLGKEEQKKSNAFSSTTLYELFEKITISNARSSPKEFNINLGSLESIYFAGASATIRVVDSKNVSIKIQSTRSVELTEKDIEQLLLLIIDVVGAAIAEYGFDGSFIIHVGLRDIGHYLISYDDYFSYSRKTVDMWQVLKNKKLSIREQANLIGKIPNVELSGGVEAMIRKEIVRISSLDEDAQKVSKTYFGSEDDRLIILIKAIYVSKERPIVLGSYFMRSEIAKINQTIFNRVASCNAQNEVADTIPIVLVTQVPILEINSSVTPFYAAEAKDHPGTYFIQDEKLEEAIKAEKDEQDLSFNAYVRAIDERAAIEQDEKLILSSEIKRQPDGTDIPFVWLEVFKGDWGKIGVSSTELFESFFDIAKQVYKSQSWKIYAPYIIFALFETERGSDRKMLAMKEYYLQ